ncbi:MAG: hypothetical protein E3J86_01935 [Candidatus Thorarchaeota archaeon]|nr:MAG: hypothetical protein E3J86_01935 [Candidatus Thorarchaeota archaeon]
MSDKQYIVLSVVGSIFGIGTGILTTYNMIGTLLNGGVPVTQLLIEAVLWTFWVGLQGIGFCVIFLKIKQSIFAGTAVVGFFATALEFIVLFTLYTTGHSINDLAFALIGIGATVLYLIMAGYSMTLLRPADSLGKIAGNSLIVTGIVLLAIPPAGFVLLVLSNLLASGFFATLDLETKPIDQPKGLALE